MNGDLFRATTRKYMELRHIRTLEQLRAHTTVSNKTFLKFWHNPDLMPLGIWEQIMDSLNVTTEDRLEIFK
jgi:phage-related protein